MPYETAIIEAIDSSPLNRGLSGAAWLAHKGNVPVVIGDDIALFDDEGDGNYEGHFLFVSRGKQALTNAREALHIMFENYSAKLIFGLTPNHLKHAKLMSRLLGFKAAGIRFTANGPCELFVLSKEMWSA